LKMKTVDYVNDVDDVRKNIIQFNIDMADEKIRKDLLWSLSSFRRWYYIEDIEMFGPAKFIGFRNINGENYINFKGKLRDSPNTMVLKKLFVKSDLPFLKQKIKSSVGKYGTLRKDIVIHVLKDEFLVIEKNPKGSVSTVKNNNVFEISNVDPVIFSDEITEPQFYFEGASKQIYVNSYERSSEARLLCIDYFGLDCTVCEFNFFEQFGIIGKEFIHVHHLVPLNQIRELYVVDPIADLRPVCPNCHAMLHKRNPAYTIDELKALINFR